MSHTFETRIDFRTVDPEAINTLLNLSKYTHKSGLERSLLDLVVLRASQINRCAFCIDMHFKDAIASGEAPQRLYGLDAWREAPYYTERERAALAWTEAVTVLTDGFVPDEVYDEVRPHFTEAELISLTMAVIEINAWNRLNVSFRGPAGDYQSQRKHKPELYAAPVGD